MPQNQIATQGHYDFGAPVTEGEVLRFRTRDNRGGKLQLLFENPDGESDGVVTVQVSPDGTTWADTTAAANLEAVADVTVERRCSRQAEILIRPNEDAFMRVQASGGTRMALQIRGDAILEIVDIGSFKPA